MVMLRGEIWWADLPAPSGSEPGFTRPVLVIQSDDINRSKLATIIVLTLTGNLKYKDLPSCMLLTSDETGLPKDSVANTTQLATVSKTVLIERAGQVPDEIMYSIDEILRQTLAL